MSAWVGPSRARRDLLCTISFHAAVGSASAFPLTASSMPSEVPEPGAERDVAALLADWREERGLKRTRLDAKLRRAARQHSAYMARMRAISHRGAFGSTFIDRIRAAGFSGYPRAENVAAGQPTARAVFDAWTKSPSHRRNMELPDVDFVGVGAMRNSSDGVIWWTMVLGRGR